MAFWKKKQEARAETQEKTQEQSVNDLIQALIGKDTITREEAMEIPSISDCIEIIARTVASLPICLYEQNGKSTKQITNDRRVHLLNKDTNDTLTTFQFWQSMIEDYYLSDGAWAYINRDYLGYQSLNYVDSCHVSVMDNFDPIFKNYVVYVDGQCYYPWNFLKLMKKTKNGCTSKSIVEEHPLQLAVMYNQMLYENGLVKKGGNKKGFLKSQKKITKEAMDALKTAFKNLYTNNSENVVVLNDGLEFQESSNTSVEMQLNENKITNAGEAAKLFNMPVSIIKGNATQTDLDNFMKFCITPLLKDIETALNRDLLFEREKESFYFAFDTRELNRGSIKERYEAYTAALKGHFLQLDEVRNLENLEPLGIDWIELGLDSVLYNPKTKEIYTPNMDAYSKLGEKKEGNNDEDRNQS